MFNYKFQSVYFIVLSLIFITTMSVTSARYLMYRRVECQSYTPDCVGVYDMRAMSSYCVNIIDPMGVKSVGNMEVSSPRSELPSKCWTNGFDVTTIDPYKVMFICGMVFVALFSIQILFNIKTLLKLREFKHSWQHDIVHDYFSYTGRRSCPISALKWFSLGILFATLLGGIIFVIVNCVYATQFSEVQCLRYATSSKPYINRVVYNNTGIIDATPLDFGTMQPEFLPSSCWTNGERVTFYDPMVLLKYGVLLWFITSLVFGGVLYVNRRIEVYLAKYEYAVPLFWDNCFTCDC